MRPIVVSSANGIKAIEKAMAMLKQLADRAGHFGRTRWPPRNDEVPHLRAAMNTPVKTSA